LPKQTNGPANNRANFQTVKKTKKMSNYNFNLSGPKEFINYLGSSDLHSFILCLEAYNNLSGYDKEPIEDIGFNQHSGYVWLYMESGITICSKFGQSVIYMFTDDDGQEHEFTTHFEACEFCQFGKISE
jgi:hypothetical protein